MVIKLFCFYLHFHSKWETTSKEPFVTEILCNTRVLKKFFFCFLFILAKDSLAKICYNSIIRRETIYLFFKQAKDLNLNGHTARKKRMANKYVINFQCHFSSGKGKLKLLWDGSNCGLETSAKRKSCEYSSIYLVFQREWPPGRQLLDEFP